jgi:hypothetical protein
MCGVRSRGRSSPRNEALRGAPVVARVNGRRAPTRLGLPLARMTRPTRPGARFPPRARQDSDAAGVLELVMPQPERSASVCSSLLPQRSESRL